MYTFNIEPSLNLFYFKLNPLAFINFNSTTHQSASISRYRSAQLRLAGELRSSLGRYARGGTLLYWNWASCLSKPLVISHGAILRSVSNLELNWRTESVSIPIICSGQSRVRYVYVRKEPLFAILLLTENCI